MYLISPENVFPYMDETWFRYFTKNKTWDLLGFFPCGDKDFGWISVDSTKGDVIPVYVFYGKKCCGPGPDKGFDWFFDDAIEDYKNPSQYILDNPWILMFQGCDNSSYGMRFKEKNLAIQFLNDLRHVDFADFFANYSDPKIGEHRLRWWNS